MDSKLTDKCTEDTSRRLYDIENGHNEIKGKFDKDMTVVTEKINKRLNIQKSFEEKFETRLNFSILSNVAVFKIFSDFFNIIYQNKEKQSLYGIEMIGLVHEKFVDNINLYSNMGTKEVLLKFLGLTIKMVFSKYKSSGEVYYEIYLTSPDVTNYKQEYVYKKLFACALKESELVGSYLIMSDGSFEWSIKELEQRSMDDIFLPSNQKEDLEMFVKIFLNKKNILRYLLVGVPGTGKTESCLVLMNELKKLNVTIIKTPVCKLIKEKVELAVLLKPCVIIFDDLDLSLGSRNTGDFSNVLQSFLDILDGTDKLPKDVGILATTNSASLLDLAAQRPGRFDKVMAFDELTKENIEKIIRKSLRFNFNITNEDEIKVFVHKKVIDKFFSNKVTGAHIYNSISMMKLKSEVNVEGFKVSIEWILSEIDNEMKILDKIKKEQKIGDRLHNQMSNQIGFRTNLNDSSDPDELEIPCAESD